MGMEELIKSIHKINRSLSSDFEGSKDLDLVKKAEKFLGITFPNTYKEFLLQLGCGDIDGEEFFGIIDDNFENSSIPNAIWLTHNFRSDFNAPTELIFISNSIDGYYAIDTSEESDNKDNPVIVWKSNGMKSQPLYSDFGCFIYSKVCES